MKNVIIRLSAIVMVFVLTSCASTWSRLPEAKTVALISVNTDFIRETLKLWTKEKYTQPDMRAFMKFSRSLLPVREIGEMGGMTKDVVKEVSEFIKSDAGKYLYPQ